MLIGLNLLHAHPQIGGGWNYIKNVVNVMASCDHANEYVAYCTDDSVSLVPSAPNVRIVRIGLPLRNRAARIIYENSVLQLRAWRDGVDVMYWFANTIALCSVTRNVVTIYDLLPFSRPEAYPWLRRVYFKTMVPASVRRASCVAAMSHATASDVLSIVGAVQDRMVVVTTPLQSQFRRSSDEEVFALRQRYGLPDKMWLYVAHCRPLKNHVRLLEAYALARSRSPALWPLVLCGRKMGRERELAEVVSRLGLEEHVKWLCELPDEDMPRLFSAATALVFPSLFEGGGIPVMEAMACGCPVTASDIPTTQEFAGDAAFMFDGTDVESITEALLRFSESADLRETHRLRGLLAAEELRGEKCFAEISSAYRIATKGNAAA